jgi:arsenate reductase
MEELGIDLSHEFPKPLTDDVVRAADAVITMCCGNACPIYPGKRYEDWEVHDPAATSLEDVRAIRDERNRVAAITDPHAKLPALEASRERIEELTPDALYCGGDPVGYGPHPNGVCALTAASRP